MSSDTNRVEIDLSPAIKVYKDGTVERLWRTPRVPPSPEDPKTGVSSKDVTISPEVSARLYLPKQREAVPGGGQKLPVVVYFHGGGFCAESAFEELEHEYMNIFASEANVLAVSVEYRLVPEHRLPAAYEDSWVALQWVASHSGADPEDSSKDPWLINNGNFDKLILAGDSAGANIVHNIALRAGGAEKLHGGVKIHSAILAFPFFWGSNPVNSMSRESNEQTLEFKLWELAYPSAPGGIDNPMINPVADGAPSLAGLPFQRMFVCTAEKDVLRERALQYAAAMEKSGWRGEIEVVDFTGEGHCFQLNDFNSEKAKDLMKRMTSFVMQ